MWAVYLSFWGADVFEDKHLLFQTSIIPSMTASLLKNEFIF